MTPQRWLQIDLAVLTVLGTVLLGVGQQNATLPLLMCVAAPAAVIFTDVLGWFRLNRPLANFAAVGSVGYAVFQFFASGVENQLLSVANLLVYLQLILLLQEKGYRLNWQLIVLSLLEVVVSAAMNLNFRFFILLLIYLFCALVALGLMFLVRETTRLEPLGRRERRREGREREPLPGSAAALFRTSSNVVRATATLTPTQLAGELVGAGYLRQVAFFGLLTIVFSTVLFYSTPRLGGTNWQGGRSGRQATVGFSRQLSLDEMGDILQSDELALRASFFDHRTNAPVRVLGEPYLRGAVLTRYSDSQGVGRWTISKSSRGVALRPPSTEIDLVRQEVWLEPMGDATVFGAFPIVRLPGSDPPLRYDRAAGVVSREVTLAGLPPGRFHYEVGSEAFRDGWQTAVVPWEPPPDTPEGFDQAIDELRDCLRFNPYQFPRIKELAEETLREADALDADPLRKARILEQHFLQPGRYQYSLRFRQSRNREMDPIEDFVANHRTGHCEYFATALVLMLRSQKIPARLIVGYHGGEYNELGNYYLVRQRDAHAWVEALLDPDQIARIGAGSLPRQGAPQGGWLRLDPTPGGGGPEESDVVWNRFDDLMEYAEFLWSDYVTGLSPERQRQTLYNPLHERLTAALAKFFDPVAWSEWSRASLSQWLRKLGVVNDLGDVGWRFVFGASLAVVTAVLAARPLIAVCRRPLGWLLKIAQRLTEYWQRRRGGGRRGRVVFYERLERLLARRGWRRPPQQTPREFLASLDSTAPWAGPAERIVDAFYRVRFGGARLAPAEADAIESALQEVARGLEAGRS